MESDSDNSLNFKIPPLHPFEMTVKDLSLTSSPYRQPPSSTPYSPDIELLKKLQLTADDFDDSLLIEQPKTEEETKFELEPELEDFDAHFEDIPSVAYTSEASKDIVTDFNREITSNKRHQGIKQQTQAPCPKCYQYLLDHEDYPLDDFEEMNVSVRSPATNRDKIKAQLKDLQADLQLYQDTSPAAAGIPITTPRRSVYPKRPMSFNPDREPEISFLPEVHTTSTPKQEYCAKKRTTPKCSQNVRFSKPHTCCYVSTPQGFPILETDTKSFKSGIPKPVRKYPVTDLRKSYRNKNQLKKHDNSKSHRIKKSFRMKNEVATILSPELTTILPHRPMDKVVSEIFEGSLEECNTCVSTPEAINKDAGKKNAPKVHNTHPETQCKLIPSQDENVAPITSRSLFNIPELISGVESLIQEKIGINDDKTLCKKETIDPRFIGSNGSINSKNKKKNTLLSENLLNASLEKLGISLPKKLRKPSNDHLQQAMVDSLNNCQANNTKTKTASTIFQLNGRSLVDTYDVWRVKKRSTCENINKKQSDSFETLTKQGVKNVGFKQFTLNPLETINNFLDIQPWESKKSFDIKEIPRSYFILGQTPTVPQRNFKSQMPSTTKIKQLRNKTVLSKINQNQVIKYCCNKSTSWSTLSTYNETADEPTSGNNHLINSHFFPKGLGSSIKKTVQNAIERPTTPKLRLVSSRTLDTHQGSKPLSAQKTFETSVKLGNKRKPSKRSLDYNPPCFYKKAISRSNTPTAQNQQQNTNPDVEKQKKLGYSLTEKQVSLKNPQPKEKVVSNSKYYKMMQLNKCPKIRTEFPRKNIMSKVSDIEKRILPWIDSKQKKLNKSLLSSKKTSVEAPTVGKK